MHVHNAGDEEEMGNDACDFERHRRSRPVMLVRCMRKGAASSSSSLWDGIVSDPLSLSEWRPKMAGSRPKVQKIQTDLSLPSLSSERTVLRVVECSAHTRQSEIRERPASL